MARADLAERVSPGLILHRGVAERKGLQRACGAARLPVATLREAVRLADERYPPVGESRFDRLVFPARCARLT